MSESPRPSRWLSALLYVLGVALLGTALFAVAALTRSRRSSAAEDRAARERLLAAGPRVAVARVVASSPDRTLVLLGEARPFFETTIYAKLSGYLRQLRFDRGARVHAHELLAVIESPETDQQYAGALADARNRHVLAARDRALAEPGIVSRQDLEAADTNARVGDATAAVIAAQRRYLEVRAPFDGMVTARYADPGSLVQAATSAQSGALPIFRISDVDHLRVFLYVDQRDAPIVRTGDPVDVTLPDRPEVQLSATISRTAGELDAHTRTLLCEVDLDDRDGRVTPGSYVRVSIHVREPSYPEIPSETINTRGSQLSVLVVDATEHLRSTPITLVDDSGQRARVLTGLTVGQRVAVNVGDSAVDGQRVQAVDLPPQRGLVATPVSAAADAGTHDAR